MLTKNNSINSTATLSLIVGALLLSTVACSKPTADNLEEASTRYQATANSDTATQTSDEMPTFITKTIATFDEPWAMTALPKQSNEPLQFLITQKTGELFIVNTAAGTKTAISGIPKVAYGGQGGLGDVVLAPDFALSHIIYLSYVEADSDNHFGAKVIKAQVIGLDTKNPSLQTVTPIWEQVPKVEGQGHYSHRLLVSPDGQYLYISSGERQKKDPAQDMNANLGKIIRLNLDGSIPNDNPFLKQKNNISQQLWTTGHRNVLGMAFDDKGRLWAHEMGPRGGDEFNLIIKGKNYGWPIVSNGRNYTGIDIPDHDTRPEFTAPKISWTPVISPSSLSIYTSGTHNDFPAWQDNALISGLSSKALIVVAIDNEQAAERYRYDMGERIRSVLAVDGEVWLLEDGKEAKLLQLIAQ